MAVAKKKILAGMEKAKKGILSFKADIIVLDSRVRKVVGNKFAANFKSIFDTIDSYVSKISEFCSLFVGEAQTGRIKGVADYLGSKTLYLACDGSLSPLQSEELLDGNISAENMKIQSLILNAIEKAGENDWVVALLIMEFEGR